MSALLNHVFDDWTNAEGQTHQHSSTKVTLKPAELIRERGNVRGRERENESDSRGQSTSTAAVTYWIKTTQANDMHEIKTAHTPVNF